MKTKYFVSYYYSRESDLIQSGFGNCEITCGKIRDLDRIEAITKEIELQTERIGVVVISYRAMWL